MTSTLQTISSVADDPVRSIESRDGMLVQVVGGSNWIGGLGLLVFLIGMHIAPTAAHAQTVYHVTETGDVSNDGSSFADGDALSLQGALSNATGDDVIVIAAGRYLPTDNEFDRMARFEIFSTQDGLKIYGGWSGTESFIDVSDVESTLNDRDLVANRTVLSGDIDDNDTTTDGITENAGDIAGNNSYTLVYLDGTIGGGITADTVIDGLVITGGEATNDSGFGPRSGGGGAYCMGRNNGSACSPQLTNIVFAGNAATHGGALFNNGQNEGVSSPEITAASFTGNRADTDGGAIYNDGFDGASSPSITNTTLTENTADNNGGAIFHDASSGGTSNPILTSAVFANNSAGNNGGALSYDASSSGTSDPILTNAVFASNSAGNNGGALHTSAETGTSSPIIINTTFTDNSADWGGGALYTDGSTSSPQIVNSILWGNRAPSGSEVFSISAAPAMNHTLVEGGVNGTGFGGSSFVGENNLDADPIFADTSDPAGSDSVFGTEDDGLRLQPGSPGLNAGDNSALPTGIDTDLLGEARIQNGTVSLGAYERDASYAGPIYYVDASATAGENDGSSFDDAFTNLQDALNRATGSDVIVIAAGTYTPGNDASDRFTLTGAQDGLKVYGGWSGSRSFSTISDVEARLGERDLASNQTTLSGENTNRTVVYLDGTVEGTITTDTVLDGMAIVDGNGGIGAGLHCSGQNAGNACSPTLNRLTFRGNRTDIRGGALYANGSNGESNPHITNSVFIDNFAQSGAAIYAQGRNGESSVRVTSTLFINNTASQSGGAVFNAGFDDGISSPEITNSVFAENTAGSNGGAMYNSGVFDGVSSPRITNSVFTGNTASSNGGAVWSGGDDGISDPQFTNVTFTRNVANNNGGALYNFVNGTGTSSPQIVNTILWNNTAGRGSEMFNEGATPTVSHTLIESGVNGGRVEGNDNTDGGDNLDTDPFFANGGNPAGDDDVFGTTDDGLRILEGAPAVNAGTNAPFESGGVAENVTTDLLAEARIQNGTVNLGAYERPLRNAQLRLTAQPAAETGTVKLSNLGTAGVTGAEVDLGLPAEVSVATTSGDGSVSDGTWTVNVPAEATATAQITYERSASAEPGLLDLTATLDTDSYTVDGSGTDTTDPDDATSDWALLEAPYGSATALAFDGTNDAAMAEAHPDISDNAPWTIAFWARVDGSASGADRQGWYLWKGPESQSENRLLAIGVADGAIEVAHWANDNTYTADVAFDTWQHVAVTYDGSGTEQVYLDGILQDERTDVGTLNVNSGAWSFAQRTGGSDRLPAEFDALRMWTEARSEADIQATMHQTILTDTPRLVASYRFDAAQTSQRFDDSHSGTTAYDLTGGRDASFEGDPQWTASGAPLGQESVVVAPGTNGTIGTNGQALTATVTSTAGRFTLYRYGDATADVFGGDALPQGETERTNLVWGAVPGNADASNTATADLTLSYGDVTVPNPGAVGLAGRLGPTQPWTARPEEPASETFTLTGQAEPQEVALYDNAPSLLYVDAAASGTGTGSSWDDAFTDLQDALDIATGNDVIVIAAGTYTPSARLDSSDPRSATFEINGSKDGLKIYGGFAGGETFTDASDVQNALDGRALSTNETILSGNINGDESDNSGNAYHVLVLNGGNGIGTDTPENIGEPTVLDGVTVTGGNGSQGGGLYCDGEGTGNACSPRITNTVFAGNSGSRGGAIYNNGRNEGTSSPQITSSTFADNSTGFRGGAIYNYGHRGGTSSPQITNSTFAGNSANSRGGAIYSLAKGGTSNPQITNSVFTDNTAGFGGGAIGSVAEAYQTGGRDGTSSPVITNVVFSGNSAGSYGGAIFNANLDGGASSLHITNSILWGNSVDNTDNEISNLGSNTTLTLGYTLIKGGIAGIDENDSSSTTEDGPLFDADPLFADAAAGDVRLTPGSPAIARGTFAPFASGGSAEDVTTDLAGEDRLFGARPDLGAFTFNDIATADNDIADATGLVGYVEPTGFEGLVLLRENTATSGGLTLTRTGEAPTDRSDELPGNVAPFTWTVTSGLDTAPRYDLLLSTEDLGGISDFSALMLYKSNDGGQTWDAVDTFSGASLVLDEDRAVVAVQDLTGFSQFAIASSTADNPLPVELAGLEAQRSGDDAVTVQWETLSETNNAGFAVQRATGTVNESGDEPTVETSQWGVSTGAGTTWQTIAMVDGAGTTDTPQSYRFDDRQLPYEADSLSYRLRQIDTDGIATFSEAVTIARQVTEAELLPTYPNPARSSATVRFAVPNRQDVRIDLYDMLGRRIRTVVDTNAEGRTEAQLDVSGLASGTYFLRMQTDAGPVGTQRVTVVR